MYKPISHYLSSPTQCIFKSKKYIFGFIRANTKHLNEAILIYLDYYDLHYTRNNIQTAEDTDLHWYYDCTTSTGYEVKTILI